MQSRYWKLFVTLSLAIFVSGCASLSSTQNGALIGGVAGGVVGNAVSDDSEATTSGVINGSYIGYQLGKDVERSR